MKTIIIILISLSVLLSVYFFILGINSKSKHPPGLLNNHLTTCPDTPNCICSEYKDHNKHYISPIKLKKYSPSKLSIIKNIIMSMGGEIQTEDEQYIAAIFTSTLFGFVDDFEIRIDKENNLIHIRSSSRVGHSDLGINKKRIELFKKHYATLQD